MLLRVSLFRVLFGRWTLEIVYVLGQILWEVLALQDDPSLIVIASGLLSLLEKLIVFFLGVVWLLSGQTPATLRHIIVIVAGQMLGHGLDRWVKVHDIGVLDAGVLGLVMVDFLMLLGRHWRQRCSLLTVQFCILQHTFVAICFCDTSLWTLWVQNKHTL